MPARYYGAGDIMKLNGTTIIIIAILVFIGGLYYLSGSQLNQLGLFSVYGYAYTDSPLVFKNGTATIYADYLTPSWDGKSVDIFIGRGGINPTTPDKTVYLAPQKQQFWDSIEAAGVGNGSRCSITVSIGVKSGDGYHGLLATQYPVLYGTILNGTLQQLGNREDFTYTEILASGNYPVYGYDEFRCWLDQPYPVKDSTGKYYGDIYTTPVTLYAKQATNSTGTGGTPMTYPQLFILGFPILIILIIIWMRHEKWI